MKSFIFQTVKSRFRIIFQIIISRPGKLFAVQKTSNNGIPQLSVFASGKSAGVYLPVFIFCKNRGNIIIFRK